MYENYQRSSVIENLLNSEPPARDIKIVRPIYGVELFDGETARFEVEISEDDVHGQWKLNGEVLSPSSVSISIVYCFSSFYSHSVVIVTNFFNMGLDRSVTFILLCFVQ